MPLRICLKTLILALFTVRNPHKLNNVITLQIPENCFTDSGAGSHEIVCPTPQNETPTPEFVVSTDGSQVNIKTWEGQKTEFYNNVIATLKLKTPLNRSVQINIE